MEKTSSLNCENNAKTSICIQFLWAERETKVNNRLIPLMLLFIAHILYPECAITLSRLSEHTKKANMISKSIVPLFMRFFQAGRYCML